MKKKLKKKQKIFRPYQPPDFLDVKQLRAELPEYRIGDQLVNQLKKFPINHRDVDEETRVHTSFLNRFTSEELKDIKYVFDMFSKEFTNELTGPELHLALQVFNIKLSIEKCDQTVYRYIMEEMEDGQGEKEKNKVRSFDFECFLSILMEMQEMSVNDFHDDIISVFNQMLSFVNDKSISKKDYLQVEDFSEMMADLNIPISKRRLEEMFRYANSKGNGKLTRDEFIDCMNSTDLYYQHL
ncbi:hypothetical protein SNEBB_005903 [Seison nebaliae]|nr:hypothetical protein SNEBB_005903 [Seison nebaliae]